VFGFRYSSTRNASTGVAEKNCASLYHYYTRQYSYVSVTGTWLPYFVKPALAPRTRLAWGDEGKLVAEATSCRQTPDPMHAQDAALHALRTQLASWTSGLSILRGMKTPCIHQYGVDKVRMHPESIRKTLATQCRNPE